MKEESIVHQRPSSSFSSSYSLSFLSHGVRKEREKEREKEENPVVAVDQTRMYVLDERESMLEEKERAKKRRMVVVREEN